MPHNYTPEQIIKMERKLAKEQGLPVRSGMIESDMMDSENKEFWFTCSSDEPYLRWFGYEILSHAPGAINTERLDAGAVPFLDNHNRDKLIGKVEEYQIDGKRMKVRVKTSRNEDATEVVTDIMDGVRPNTSIMYRVDQLVPVLGEDGKQQEKNGEPVFMASKWTIYEVSSVTIPADFTVGYERSLIDNFIKETKSKEGDINMPNENEKTQTPEEIQKSADFKRYEELKALGKEFKEFDWVSAYNRGLTASEAKQIISETAEKNTVPTPVTPDIKITRQAEPEFSIGKAIEASLEKSWGDAEYERNVIVEETEKRRRSGIATRGIPVSAKHLRAAIEKSVRTLQVGGTAANVVQNTVYAQDFIGYLYNESVVIGNGARMMNVPNGNVYIPKQSGKNTAYWVGESSATTPSDMTLTQLQLTPKTVSGKTSISRLARLQSNPAIEGLAMDGLLRTISMEIDRATLHGSGLSNQPTGVAGTSGIGSVDLSAGVTYRKIREFKKDIVAANIKSENLRWLTTPSIWESLGATEKVAGYPQFLLGEDDKMLGYNLVATNQVASGYLFLGDITEIIVAFWGGLDLVIDGLTSDANDVAIKAFQTMDIGVRYPGAFAVSSNVTFS